MSESVTYQQCALCSVLWTAPMDAYRRQMGANCGVCSDSQQGTDMGDCLQQASRPGQGDRLQGARKATEGYHPGHICLCLGDVLTCK